MSLTVSYRMNEDDLVKLLDYYGPLGLNAPFGANRAKLLGAIVHGHVLDLEAQGKIPTGPLDLAYLERRLREVLYQRSDAGQQRISISPKRILAEQQAVISADDISEDIEGILSVD